MCSPNKKSEEETSLHASAPGVLSEVCDQEKTDAHMAEYPGRWEAAFDFIDRSRKEGIEAGTYDILPGGEVFAIVSEYVPRDADSCRIEAHRKYIDLQYLMSGKEQMGITVPAGLVVAVPYVDDIEFYEVDGVDIRYDQADSSKYFTFFPDDPHRPSMRMENQESSAPVKKIVVKIKF